MLSLIFLLVLGWLLYKALFPGMAPYYGESFDDEDHSDLFEEDHKGLWG
ncbi:MAG: hypothetical protein M1438_14375 [Deltaproteobacteria bacterium]|nr:hypothetical protein [Deltaproteobacteria bacterium]